VGSGEARTFLDKATIIFKEMGIEPDVEYVDLPQNLKGKYQYYTCANMDKVRAAGFSEPLTRLEDGLRLYVRKYLESADAFR
jgi:ADP-L-glycero-D-manno-heptose 6-epimerase